MEKIFKIKIVKEVTPKEMSCIVGGCPAIFETNNNSYVVIGKKINSKSVGLSKRVSKDEILIEIPKKLIDKKQ